ncbi:MAG: SDR family NAD(P)-dependent oxidoreductase [Albidovulum sp.]|nr:SDR family NAD(P)-dependent oxidoreductase [Albidovulum sp.]
MTGSVAIITGGLSGIGLAAAEELIRRGHKVAAGSRSGGGGKLKNDAMAILGEHGFASELDVRSQISIDDFVALTRERLGTPLILVNAAGIFREGFLSDHSDSAWNDQIDINLSGPFRMIRSVFPFMIRAGFGRIVNVASTAARRGASGYAGYCASKAGLVGLSLATSQEGAPHNVACISISPTWVETPMMEAAVKRMAKAGGKSSEEARADIHNSNPQNRIVQPNEIASIIGYFCSEAPPSLTNVDIQVNAAADW